jgi:Asp-tRNA(Asn)/Glu-tRNA(Gln) amidotransferase A subunit family amidase
MDGYENYDALGLAELVRTKKASPSELLDAALTRLDAVNPKINAVAHRYENLARAQIAAGLGEGPFAGVPFMLKDLGATLAGAPMTAGSLAWKDNVPTEDSEFTRRVKRAGFAIFGSTATPELGLTTTTENRLTGRTCNPWALDRIAGGSSGGAAAVTAAGVIPMAHASDGGGSIRIPAAMCGLFGMKPSRGRTPMGPRLTEGWMGMSTVGAVSRSVRDSAAFFDAVSGPEPGARVGAPPTPDGGFLAACLRAPGKLRIAYWPKAPSGVPVDTEVLHGVANAAQLCESLGHAVEEVAPPFLEEARRAVAAVIGTCAARDVDEREKARGRPIADEEIEPATRLYRAWAREHTAKELAEADLAMQRQAVAMARFLENYDVILQPVTAKPPVALGLLALDDPQRFGREVTLFSPFTAVYNQTGQPSMSAPLHWTKDNLPIGVMFTGRYGEEGLLFSLGAQLEAAKPWWDKRPPV